MIGKTGNFNDFALCETTKKPINNYKELKTTIKQCLIKDFVTTGLKILLFMQQKSY